MCGKKHQGTLWKFHISLHSICKWQAWVLGRSRAFCWNSAWWEYIKLVMHTQPSLGPPQPLKLGPLSHLLSHAAGLKLMLTAWRLIYDKHLFLSSWELSHHIEFSQRSLLVVALVWRLKELGICDLFCTPIFSPFDLIIYPSTWHSNAGLK